MKGCQGLLTVSGRVFAIGTGTRRHRPLPPARIWITTARPTRSNRSSSSPARWASTVRTRWCSAPTDCCTSSWAISPAPKKSTNRSSPYHHYYEGDLLQPRYEDASGHAVGIKAPGGSILRTDTSGTAVELVAGGLQNPYDLAFNADGELFTADSDMEWDLGMPWFRPTRVNHVVPGAEFGWRSGWAKWPDYYFDSLPPVVEMGRGSPTGIEVYGHHMFPQRYHNCAVRLRLVARPHPGRQTQAARRHLQGLERSLPRRPAAERHRHLGRPGRLALFLHRRPRHRGGYLPRRLGGGSPGRTEKDAQGNRRRAEATATLQRLGPAAGRDRQETNGRRLAARALGPDRRPQGIRRRKNPQLGAVATVWTVPHARRC